MKNILFMIISVCTLSSSVSSQKTGEWVTVQTFSGSSIQTTDDFFIKTIKWRIIWEAKEIYEGAGLFFSGFVKCDDECGSMGKIFANVIQADNGESVFRTKGSHYIDINSSNCKWYIKVQAYITK